MKIYLDDTRKVPDGFILVKNYTNLIKLLKENVGNIEYISLDHDLGTKKNGYDVCLWLIENNYWIDEINIHSANTVGIGNMFQLLNRYAPKEVKITTIKLK